jgi:adenosylmethionine-8-amino-7-oxononanoate aminotransferase
MEKDMAEKIKELDIKYVWHHFCNPKEYAKNSFVLERAEGSKFWDVNGKEYIDAIAGVEVVNVGYGNKEIINAMKIQMDKLIYNCLVYASSPPVALAAEKIVQHSPKGLEKVWFVTGGSEAVDTCIKIARQYHYLKGNKGKYKVIARWMSYHGATLGALSCTGHPPRREVFDPLLLKFPHIPACYCYRCPFGKEYPNCDIDCAWALDYVIKTERASTVSAFIAEPIVGLTAAGLVPPKEYYDIVREICDKYDVLFITDEVLTGFGRTGKMFAIDHYDALPDMMAIGKGITSGYAPLGAVVTRKEIEEVFEQSDLVFQHGHTFGGHPVACVACLANIEVIVKNNLTKKAEEMGNYLMKRLRELNRKIIGDVRGKGLLVGIELVKEKDTKKIFGVNENIGAKVAYEALKRGVKIFGTKAFDSEIMSDILFITPPLIITKKEIDKVIEVIDESIKEVEKDF